jgi:hypothetical protein
MGWLIRFLCNWLGGMVAAAAAILVYVYLLGAPHLPRLPIIGLPEHYLALALIALWALVQLYLTTLGAVTDGLLGLTGLRAPPGARMAFGHGFFATIALLALAIFYRPTAFSIQAALLAPLAVQACVRLIAGRLPSRPDAN